jgi:hypothetical protein
MLAIPGVAFAARYASPSGSGTSCTQSAPCDVATAVSGAADNGEVVIGSGTYGSPASPLSPISTSAAAVNVHGADPANPPLIYLQGPDSFSFTGNAVRIAGLHIENVTTGLQNNFAAFHVLDGATVDRVYVHTEVAGDSTHVSTACAGSSSGETWTNDVCWDTHTNSRSPTGPRTRR